MTPDITAVAEGLTAKQRAAILNAERIAQGVVAMWAVDHTDPWTAPVAQFLTLRRDRLTPLGERVREHLEAQS